MARADSPPSGRRAAPRRSDVRASARVAPRTTGTRDRAGPAIGLALAGGGFLGAAYELGALAALSETFDGLDLTRLDSYVGVSAGSFIAAGLANGVSPHHMVRMFVESETSDEPFDPAEVLGPDYREWARALRSLPEVTRDALRAGLADLAMGPRAAAWRALQTLTRLLPTGLIDARPARSKLARLFSLPGRTDDFRELATVLRIVATDIDSGQSVEFGGPGFDDVPISRAVVASCAVPGLFSPVRVHGRYFVDGALNKTLHASVALEHGAKLVLCVNPIVPYAAPHGTAGRRIAHSTLPTVLSQTIRTTIRSRMSVGIEKYRVTHPDATVLLFEPRREDAEIFFSNIFTLSGRRRLCEHAYQQTRADVRARRDSLTEALAPFGIAINARALDDERLTLVRARPLGRPRRSRGLVAATAQLRELLDDLDRARRIGRLA